MSLLEGEERSDIPSMSWTSVVGGASPANAPSPEPDAPEPSPDGQQAVSFNTTSISPTVDETMTAPPADRAPSPKVSLNIDSPIAEPVAVPTPPVFSTPSFGSLLATDEATPDALPVIVEATPSSPVHSDLGALSVDAPSPAPASPVPPPPVVQPVPASQHAPAADSAPAPVEASATVAEPAPESVPAAAVPSPQLDQSAALSLPQQQHSVLDVSHAAAAAPKARRAPKKDRSTAIARMGFFLLLVAAVVSAGVIFGRPYLFSEAWEENALPFADSVEAARGTDFVESITLVPQPTTTHRDLVAAQLLGTPSADVPMWRALGLAGPDATDDSSLHDLIAQQGHVLYSTADGQVYYDQAFTQAHRDALITRSMAAAALDQDFGYSTDAAARSTDGAALTAAHVLQQSTLIQEQSSYDRAVPGAEVAPLAFLPPVLDYRLSAPIVFAELLPPVNELVANPLAEIGADGPGPIASEPLADIAANSNADTNQVARDAVATDRSFWYMVFAAHLDAPLAYDMSNQLQQARLQMVTDAEGTCAVATLAGGDGAVNEQLRLNLDAWVAVAAPELGASVTSLPDLSTQLRSCDPISGYVSNAKFGVGRQLIAWRAAELAVTNAMTAQGADQGQIDQALSRLSSTPSVIALTELPAGTPPIDLADAARLAAVDVIGTPADATQTQPIIGAALADSAEG
jgi:hypothetical protein